MRVVPIIILIILASFSTVTNSEEDRSASSANDTPKQQNSSPQSNELILRVKVKNLELGDIFGFKTTDNILIGLQGLTDVLNFPIKVNIEELSARGWYINRDHSFLLKRIGLPNSAAKLTTDSASKSFSSNEIKVEDDIYLNIDKLLSAMEIEYELDLKALTLIITPPNPLPIQEKLERQKKKPAHTTNYIAQYPRRYTPYRVYSIPFVDVQSQLSKTSLGSYNTNYSALGAGDLAFMTGTYYASGNNDVYLRNFRLTLSRQSLQNKLLGPLKASYVSFGDITPTPIYGFNSAQELGARITNTPMGQVTLYNQMDFTGDTQPGWDVELYRNGLFLGMQTVGENGRYEFFNQNLLYGENIFRLVFYGPQGQKREKVKRIILDNNTVTAKKTIYDISISRQNQNLFDPSGQNNVDADYRRFSLNLSHNLGDFSTFQIGFTNYRFYDGIRHYFVQSNIKLNLLSTLLNFSLTKDLQTGQSYNFRLTRSLDFRGKHVFALSRTVQTANYRTNSNTVTSLLASDRLTISGPILSFLNFNYSANAATSKNIGGQSINRFGVDFSAAFWRLRLSNNLNYSRNYYVDKSSTRNISGVSNFSLSMGKIHFRGGSSYILNPENRTSSLKTTAGVKSITTITRLDGTLGWYPSSKIKSQIGAGYIVATKAISKRLSLSWRTKHVTFTSNFTYINSKSFMAYLGLNFSLGYDRKTSLLKFTSERIAKTGAITAKVYSDDNNNGVHDKNEKLYKDVKIEAIQAKKSIETNDIGTAFLTGLPSDRVTDVRLDRDSLEDPFITPATNPFSFLPRPGLVEEIEIPLVMAGEIEGTVILENKNGTTQNAGYVPIVLTNVKTRESRKVISAYDGFYLFSNIPPGKYLVSIDNAYLKKNRLLARKPMPRIVDIYSTGNVDMENNFSLYENEKARPSRALILSSDQ